MKRIKLEPFDREVHVYINPIEYKNALDNKYNEELEDNVEQVYGYTMTARNTRSKRTHVLVLVNADIHKTTKKDDYFLISTLNHECFHATMAVYKSLGADAHEALEEPVAYLNDYIFKHALKYLVKADGLFNRTTAANA